MVTDEFFNNQNIMNEINLSYVDIKYIDPIVYYYYKEDIELGFPEIRELIACAEKLSNYKPYVVIAFVKENMKITNEGKKVLDDPNNLPLFRGTAAIVDNSFYKYAANFLNVFNKPKHPFQAFTSEKKAIDWLLNLPLK